MLRLLRHIDVVAIRQRVTLATMPLPLLSYCDMDHMTILERYASYYACDVVATSITFHERHWRGYILRYYAFTLRRYAMSARGERNMLRYLITCVVIITPLDEPHYDTPLMIAVDGADIHCHKAGDDATPLDAKSGYAMPPPLPHEGDEEAADDIAARCWRYADMRRSHWRCQEGERR